VFALRFKGGRKIKHEVTKEFTTDYTDRHRLKDTKEFTTDYTDRHRLKDTKEFTTDYTDRHRFENSGAN
jgi:hypothetical protein